MLFVGSALQGRAYSFSLQITWMWEQQPFQPEEAQVFVQAGLCSLFHTPREAEAGPAQAMLCTGTAWAWKKVLKDLGTSCFLNICPRWDGWARSGEQGSSWMAPSQWDEHQSIISLEGHTYDSRNIFFLTSVTLLHSVLSFSGKNFLLHTSAIWKSLL